MSYQDQATELANQTTQQVLAIMAAYVAGKITAEIAVAMIAAFLNAAKATATALGDLALAAAVSLSTRRPAVPMGLLPTDEIERLEQAAQTILGDLLRAEPEKDLAADEEAARESLEKTEKRFRRLIEAEIRKDTADAYAEALEDNEDVTGWVRGLEPDACQLCTWWHRNGRVWPADHPIPRHHGCDCSQLVVTTTEPAKPVRYH